MKGVQEVVVGISCCASPRWGGAAQILPFRDNIVVFLHNHQQREGKWASNVNTRTKPSSLKSITRYSRHWYVIQPFFPDPQKTRG